MEPFLGQIQAFGFNFAPRGWATCDGQLMSISENTALFSLLGTTYGGDGRTTFALPDLRGRTMLHQGSGPGLSPRRMGEKSGTEHNTLNVNQLPAHGHGVNMPVSSEDATSDEPGGNVLAVGGANLYHAGASAGSSYQGFNTGNAGANQSINNMQPYLVVNVCIALVGVYPSRN
jgi:microcystin-dependent protein